MKILLKVKSKFLKRLFKKQKCLCKGFFIPLSYFKKIKIQSQLPRKDIFKNAMIVLVDLILRWLSLVLNNEFQQTLKVQYFLTVACLPGTLWFKSFKELHAISMVFTDFNWFENHWEENDFSLRKE